tara:strand:- start:91 stop:381 length:291 start_codon:yes stop_codon:yes gene_type:complete
MKTLEFVKVGKPYVSKHGGNWFHIYFKDENKSYRTALFENMRNFNNWNVIVNLAERGDLVGNLRTKIYKGKEIVDADSWPKLMPSIKEIEDSIYND